MDGESRKPPADQTLKFLRRRDGEVEAVPVVEGTAPGSDPPPRPAVDVAGLTDRGRVRKDNQDQFLIAEMDVGMTVRGSSFADDSGSRIVAGPPALLLVVADGIGGHRGGEVASQVAVDRMAHHAFTAMPWLLNAPTFDQEALAEGLQRAADEAQARIREVARRKGLDPHAGTTLTMAYVAWPRCFVLHAGDSRAYLHRGRRLGCITRDHTMAQELVERELMTPEAAARSRFSHVLMNAVGGGDEPVQGEFHELALEPGDALLLCSDGLTGYVDDGVIAAALAAPGADAAATVRDLVAAANRRGGEDNVTVVLARF